MITTFIHIVGARPNFIKAATLVKYLNTKSRLQNLLVHTGQHYDHNMAGKFFEELNLKPDIFLNSLKSGTDIANTADIMMKCENIFKKYQPTAVIVYGDVNSTLAASIVAKKLKIKIVHIESGLRSFDRNMPEEINRIITDSISDIHFTTCQDGINNLINEGHNISNIHMVGNTMIDTLVRLKNKFIESNILKDNLLIKKKYVLITLHRPSNVDQKESLKALLEVLCNLSSKYTIVFPMHPRTLKNIEKFELTELKNISNVIYLPPVGYIDFMKLQMDAKLIITDSGGIQEESSYFNVPCLTIRDNTERPITIDKGTNKLIGTDYNNIINEIEKINFNKKSNIKYWDGKSSVRISNLLGKKLNLKYLIDKKLIKVPMANSPNYSSGVVVHDNFVSINGLQRCGTTSLREYFINVMEAGLISGDLQQYIARYHMPIRLCNKEDLHNKKILGNIRNPFTFYASFIDYHLNTNSGYLSGMEDYSFKEILYNLLFEIDWINFVNELDGFNYTNRQFWETNKQLQVGLYTKRYINMFFVNGDQILNYWTNQQFFENHDKELTVTNIIKLENFKEDIDAAISIEKTCAMPYVNESSYNASNKLLQNVISEKYDNESITWVKERDKIFFDKYYKD